MVRPGPHLIHGSFSPPEPIALWYKCADMVYNYIVLACLHSYTIMFYWLRGYQVLIGVEILDMIKTGMPFPVKVARSHGDLNPY